MPLPERRGNLRQSQGLFSHLPYALSYIVIHSQPKTTGNKPSQQAIETRMRSQLAFSCLSEEVSSFSYLLIYYCWLKRDIPRAMDGIAICGRITILVTYLYGPNSHPSPCSLTSFFELSWFIRALIAASFIWPVQSF